jgi:phage terminase large subunit-like protein
MSLQQLDVSAAARELEGFERFCRRLVLEDGTTMQLEPFQRTLLVDYFGGVRETLVLLSKKNGKTTLLAALALFHLLLVDDAECVIAASSRDQATILFDQAVGFIRRTAALQGRVIAKRGYREIRKLSDSGRIRVLAADVDHVDGVLPTLALVDEMHRHKSAALYGIFRDSLGPRDGQMLTISTAGDNEQSALGMMHASALRLPELTRVGRYTYAHSPDGSYALHEWALLKDDDVNDMQLVKQVNPASWQTEEVLRQRHDSPSMLPWQWARFACGIWVAAEEYWLDAALWHEGETLESLLPGDRVALGFDGSRFGDATALCACRLSDGLVQLLDVWQAPDKAPDDWEVPAGEVDAALADAMSTYKVVRGYFDPPLWQSEIDEWAREYGETAVMRFHTNRSRMMGAVERFRTDVNANKIPHVYDERLTSHVLSAQMREARSGYWLTKTRAGNVKIDAAIAAVLAYEARCDAVASGAGSTGAVWSF